MTTETRTGLMVYVGVAFIYFLFAAVAGMGLLSVYAGFDILWTGRESVVAGAIALGMGTVLSLIGLGFFYVKFVRSRVWAAQENRLRALYPDQPWMMRDDWRARRVVHTNIGAMVFMWIWVAGWWSGIALIGRVNYDKIVQEIQNSWGNIFFVIIFVGAGILGLVFAIKLTRAHLRFGNTSLTIDTLPGYLGERFRGTVSAGLPKLPLEPLSAELVCQLLTERRRRVSGKTETSIETTDLWKTTVRISPAKLVPAGSRVQIPVSIDLPDDQPETEMQAGLGICWTLHLSTSGRQDPAFSCSFPVPVYRRR